jgi:uncharacterized ferritin-like protein (DUF455 family)
VSAPAPSPDDRLFAPGPARDARFTVVDRWTECANFSREDPLRQVEFFHRQMNEEMNGLEASARHLADFPEAAWELRMWFARQCSDEARHVRLFREMFERRGGEVGRYPVMNFQYRIITNIQHLVGRLAVQNRSFEAGGIDAVTYEIDAARNRGDEELAELFEAQLADEIIHVRFANEWIRRFTREDPRRLLQMGLALRSAAKAFAQVMGREGTDHSAFPAAWDGRREAGFTDEEIQIAAALAEANSIVPGP